MTGEFKLLIDGKLVPGAARLDVINPATGKVFTSCPRADRRQLEQAIVAAKTAFGAWSRKSIAERRKLLFAVADAMEARVEEFTRLLTQEQGKPTAEAAGEVGGSVAMIRLLAEMDLPVRTLLETPQQRIVQRRAPLGVVAAIMPWNFPLLLLILKAVPALLAGNTVVAKPAPTTPLTALLFGAVVAELLPPGTLNIIVDQNDLGEALTSHPDIAKVAFTGSTATGRKVMASAASTLKRITLELGGNDAAIVLDDADVTSVARSLYQGAMGNAGQVCVAVKRVYVPAGMYQPMCEALAELARRTVVGDGLDPATQMGPMQNQAQYARVLALLDDTRGQGKIIAGGHELDREGYFIAPTIVRDIADSARLVREEQFGPVLPVLQYSSIDEALDRANDTEYGLSGSVWGRDLERAYEIAQRMVTGTVTINRPPELNPNVPLGGCKQSGIGVELGQEGLEEYTQSRVINLSL